MPSISVSQHVWEFLQRESQRRGGEPINSVLGELLGVTTTTAARSTHTRTPIKVLREAIVIALGQLDGRATKREVLTRLPSIVSLTPEDSISDLRGKPRWEVQAGQAASQLRREGVLKVARHGVWALATAPPNALGPSAPRIPARTE